MRLKLLLVALVAVFLLFTGFFPGKLPFNPGARYSDAVTSHWGAALFLQKSVVQNRTFPLWRETIMAGAPFAANPLNKTAYPPQWLALILPPALHLDVMILLHLLLAGWGMWRWTRAQGLRHEAAGLSALAYALSPRLIGHTGAGHLDLLYALAWFPWLMAAVYRFVHYPSFPDPFSFSSCGANACPNQFGEKGKTRFLSLSSFTATKVAWERDGSRSEQGEGYAGAINRFLQITLFAALVFLADTRLSLFALSLAAAYGLYEIAGTRQWKRLMWILPAVVVFILLTVSVTAPLLGWSPYLSRAGLTAQEAGVFSLEPEQFIGLALPPQGGNIETLTYVGLPVLILAGVALMSIPRKLVFWLIVLVFAGWFALGQNGLLWSALVRLFPVLLWFRVPSRAWLVIGLVAPLLAGYGLHWLIERLNSRAPRRWRLYALIGLVASLVCGIFTIVLLPLPDAAGWSVLVGGGGLSVVLLLLFGDVGSTQRAALLIALVIFADLLIAGSSWLEWRGEEDWLTPYQPLAETLIEDDAARIYSPSYSLPQQVAEAYDLRLFGGVDPFQIEGVAQAVAQAGGIEQRGYSVVAPPLNDVTGDDPATANRDAVPDTDLLKRWEVSHIVAAYPLDHARLELLDEMNGVFVYRNLDYAPSPADDTLPRWQTTSGNLPDPATVEYLNRLTLLAAGVATATFIVSLLALFKTIR